MFVRQNDASTITSDEFLGLAGRLATELASSGSHCINLCEDRLNFSLGFCAGLIANTPNLLPGNRLPKTISRLIQDYSNCIVLAEEELSGELALELALLGTPSINIERLLKRESEAGSSNAPLAEMLTAAIVFTSGSTGEPTSITKRWHTLCGTTDLLQRRFLTPHQLTSIVATVPPQHMYGLEMSVMMPLRGNCCVHTGRPFYPADIVNALSSMPEPRLLVTTPVHMKALVLSGIPLPDMYGAVSATAPLDPDLAAAAEQAWNCPVHEIYGCSEGGSLASRSTVNDENWTLLDCISLNKHSGQFIVSAPHLVDAVVLQDELEIISQSQFRFLGRGGDMLNIGGKRASLIHLNRELLTIDGVDDGVFFTRSRPGGEERLAALVVTKLTTGEVSRKLAKVIDPVFLPRPLKKVTSIPRNSLGKSTFSMLQSALSDTRMDTNNDDY
ncbi:MAG: AMP-binding protein [Halioglobus sp.]